MKGKQVAIFEIVSRRIWYSWNAILHRDEVRMHKTKPKKKTGTMSMTTSRHFRLGLALQVFYTEKAWGK